MRDLGVSIGLVPCSFVCVLVYLCVCWFLPLVCLFRPTRWLQPLHRAKKKTSDIANGRYQEFAFLCLFVCLFVSYSIHTCTTPSRRLPKCFGLCCCRPRECSYRPSSELRNFRECRYRPSSEPRNPRDQNQRTDFW